VPISNFLFFLQDAVVPNVPTIPASHGAGGGFSTLLVLVFILICAGLITLVLLQTTKSEGLSGSIGGTSQSIFRGKKSTEEQLSHWTSYLAIAFLVGAVLIAVFTYRH